MTGDACTQEGLRARQIVTLDVRNVGLTDSEEAPIDLWFKVGPSGEAQWQELGDKKAVAYTDLLAVATPAHGWRKTQFKVPPLLGTRSMAGQKGSGKDSAKLILASTATGVYFYGSVFLPVEISWTDRITQQSRREPIMSALGSTIVASLGGASLFRSNSACKAQGR